MRQRRKGRRKGRSGEGRGGDGRGALPHKIFLTGCPDCQSEAGVDNWRVPHNKIRGTKLVQQSYFVLKLDACCSTPGRFLDFFSFLRRRFRTFSYNV